MEKAEPDDLVVLNVSSHGFTSKEGTCYMIPSDSGDTEGTQITPALLEKWVSSDELSGSMRDVDAGDLVMIVDTCHSAATAHSKNISIDEELSGGSSSLKKPSAFRQPSFFNFQKQRSPVPVAQGR